ncbi:HAD-like domain-containing protein [Scheffersomyces amazonensis]|uniref:HAD-like domain-containing protein n=1 Tax=Scheffersomyces amazonensis TaxID=1078765 RepID=UPI00315DCC57
MSGMVRPLVRLRKIGSPAWRPDLIITDWDETVTSEDTIKLVAQVPYDNNDNLEPKFQYFTDIYLASYKKYVAEFYQQYGNRDSLDKEILFQRGMKQVELSSVTALANHKIFANLSENQFARQASNIKLRPGFVDCFRSIQKLNIPIVILSINWTSILIKQALRDAGLDCDYANFLVNEFEFDDNHITTGNWVETPSIRTALDKLELTKQLIANSTNSVYLGDSSTDLLSLLHVDTGIIIPDTSLAKSIQNYAFAKDKLYLGTWHDLHNLLTST